MGPARKARGGRGANQYQRRGSRVISDRIETARVAQAFGAVDSIPAQKAVRRARTTRDVDAQVRWAFHPDPVVRTALLHNPRCYPDLVDMLCDDPSAAVWMTAWRIRHDPHGVMWADPPTVARVTSELWVLQRSAKDPDNHIRRCVAINPSTPVEVLRSLAGDEDPDVRAAVVNNPNCDVETFMQVRDDYQVLAAKAASSLCPPDLLRTIASGTKGIGLRGTALRNPNCPPDALRDCWGMFVDSDILANPNCPPDVIRQAAASETGTLRRTAAQHPNCPVDVLRLLCDDPDVRVADAAFVRTCRR